MHSDETNEPTLPLPLHGWHLPVPLQRPQLAIDSHRLGSHCSEGLERNPVQGSRQSSLFDELARSLHARERCYGCHALCCAFKTIFR
jgi:hypothetical protein